jgi:hypothetical protein
VVGVTVVWPLPGVSVMVFCEHKVHGFAVVVVAKQRKKTIKNRNFCPYLSIFNDLFFVKQIVSLVVVVVVEVVGAA